MKTHHRNSERAVTLTEVLIIVALCALISIMYLAVIQNTSKRSREPQCINNLKTIGLAFRQWALGSVAEFPMQVSTNRTYEPGTLEYIETGEVFRHFQALSNELGSPTWLVCPKDNQRRAVKSFNELNSNTNISYFVGVDAKDVLPTAFLAGDRNLTNGPPIGRGVLVLTSNSIVGWTGKIHSFGGNVGFADGSVQALNIGQLERGLANSDLATNRLAMPVE